MALHAAEQILAAFQSKLKASADVAILVASASIVRDRVDPASVLPDVSIEMGADTVIEGSDENMHYIDSWLEVDVVVEVKTTTGVATDLNAVRKAIHKAIYADVQLGLSTLVVDGHYTGASKPANSGDVEKPVSQQVITYKFWYRTSRADPSA